MHVQMSMDDMGPQHFDEVDGARDGIQGTRCVHERTLEGGDRKKPKRGKYILTNWKTVSKTGGRDLPHGRTRLHTAVPKRQYPFARGTNPPEPLQQTL